MRQKLLEAYTFDYSPPPTPAIFNQANNDVQAVKAKMTKDGIQMTNIYDITNMKNSNSTTNLNKVGQISFNDGMNMKKDTISGVKKLNDINVSGSTISNVGTINDINVSGNNLSNVGTIRFNNGVSIQPNNMGLNFNFPNGGPGGTSSLIKFNTDNSDFVVFQLGTDHKYNYWYYNNSNVASKSHNS